MTSDAHDYAMTQIAAADTGRADNQCPTCGAYRTDGQPPATHRGGCGRDLENWLALHTRASRGLAT